MDQNPDRGRIDFAGVAARLRFSTGGLLMLMALAALLLGFATLAPRWLATLVYSFTYSAIGVSLLAGAVVLRGDHRVFCLAALFPVLALPDDSLFGSLAVLPRQSGAGAQALMAIFFTLLSQLICGLMGVFAARLLRKRFGEG